MNVRISYDSISAMLDLVRKLKQDRITIDDVVGVVCHPDYEMEFNRYGKHITKEAFCDYFLTFPGLQEQDVTNPGLRAHHRYYLDLYEHLDVYERNLSRLEAITEDFFRKQVDIALNGLPDDLPLEEVNFIFTIGIGQSFGYIYETNTHFDFLQLVKDHDITAFQSTIAHEVHHVGFNTVIRQLDFDSISLEQLFYIYFAGEGLAVKYCNNAEGVLSKAIHPTTKNVGLDAYTWQFLGQDFETSMARFHDVVSQIREHKITTEEELLKELQQFWMNPYIDGQPKDKPPRLKHFRLYSFGNEIWGIIHDCFGKDKVYATLRDIKKFPDVFNQALRQLNADQYAIPKSGVHS